MVKNPIKPSRRQLKVYSKYQGRMYHRHVICPEIRLCGRWLEEFGFHLGRSVTVQPGPGCLIITLKGRKPAVQTQLPAPMTKRLPAAQVLSLVPATKQ